MDEWGWHSSEKKHIDIMVAVVSDIIVAVVGDVIVATKVSNNVVEVLVLSGMVDGD